MLAPTSTRNGACWIGRGLIGTDVRSWLSSALASSADCTRCRVCAISHRITSISRVPPPKTGIATPSDSATRRASSSARSRLRKKTSAPAAVRRSEALAWRLTNTSALLLFANAARSSSGSVRSSSRVSSTRAPRRVSRRALDATRDGQRQRLLQRAARALGPVLVAAVTRIDHDRCAHPASAAAAARPLAACRRGRGRARRRRLIGGGKQIHDDAAGVGARRRRPRAQNEAKRGPRPITSVVCSTATALDEPLRLHDGQRGIEQIGLEAHQQTRAVLRDLVRGRRRHVQRDPGLVASDFMPHDDARHAHPPANHQAAGLPQLERHVVDGRQRAADELHRQVPAPADARRRRRQRHQPSADGGQRLVLRDDDGAALVADRDRARQRVFAHEHAEDRGQVVDRHQLGVADDDRGNGRAPSSATSRSGTAGAD